MATSISVRRHGGLTIWVGQDEQSLAVSAFGDLDIDSAPAFEDSVLHALESGVSSIVLDLAGVTFIDPTGLRVLLWAAAPARGERIRIDRGSPAVRRLLELTHKEQALPLTA
jgi:anti-sigma B factor antagonist